jgi:hypothetical protein
MQMQGTPQSGRPAALFVSLTRSVCRSFPQDLSIDYRGCNRRSFSLKQRACRQKHQRRLPIHRNLIARIRSLIIHVIFAGGNRCGNFFNASSCRPAFGSPDNIPGHGSSFLSAPLGRRCG